ncbi:hypothetical protein BHM03_00010343 [Ensete ventricosum]|nr:hypothetical protein BHM03_00010343 [Ensete ventricosum]
MRQWRSGFPTSPRLWGAAVPPNWADHPELVAIGVVFVGVSAEESAVGMPLAVGVEESQLGLSHVRKLIRVSFREEKRAEFGRNMGLCTLGLARGGNVCFKIHLGSVEDPYASRRGVRCGPSDGQVSAPDRGAIWIGYFQLFQRRAKKSLRTASGVAFILTYHKSLVPDIFNVADVLYRNVVRAHMGSNLHLYLTKLCAGFVLLLRQVNHTCARSTVLVSSRPCLRVNHTCTRRAMLRWVSHSCAKVARLRQAHQKERMPCRGLRKEATKDGVDLVERRCRIKKSGWGFSEPKSPPKEGENLLFWPLVFPTFLVIQQQGTCPSQVLSVPDLHCHVA